MQITVDFVDVVLFPGEGLQDFLGICLEPRGLEDLSLRSEILEIKRLLIRDFRDQVISDLGLVILD